jgi:hypothetical protein
MPSTQNSTKVLGKVTAPSGVVMLIDFGLMALWTHDRPPLVPPGILSDEALKFANNAADFTIEVPTLWKPGESSTGNRIRFFCMTYRDTT